jgi:CheY-like chemotaxis protein
MTDGTVRKGPAMESDKVASLKRVHDQRPGLRKRRVRRSRDRAGSWSVGRVVPANELRIAEPEPAIILVADDDRELRGAVARILRGDGYEVIEVADTTELLDYLAAVAFFGTMIQDAIPDLILSDLQMPGGEPASVLGGLQRSSRSIPYVVMTAFADDETRGEAIRCGASLVLDKPFDRDRLRATVRNIVG